MTNPRPYYSIDLEEIAARNATARHMLGHMLAGFSAEMPTLADFWELLNTALSDIQTLSGEVARLNAELISTRLGRANLLAVIRATLAAYADGDDDPLWYLRDELDAHQTTSQPPGRTS